MRVRQRAVRNRTEFIVAALRLCKNILQERAMKIRRNLSISQNVPHDPPMSHLGVFQTQGMAWQTCRAQEFAHPLAVP